MTQTTGPKICLSIINIEGGVGKTSVVALLGRYASIYLGLDVHAIYLDPHVNLSQAFIRDNNTRSLMPSGLPPPGINERVHKFMNLHREQAHEKYI